MSANNSLLETSAFYYTALGSMIEEFNQETTPGFKVFSKYARHSSSTFRDATAPKQIQNDAVGDGPTGSGTDNDRNVQNNIIAEPASSTPRRPTGVMRKHNLFSEHLLMAVASKPPAPVELSPISRERKRALERAESERLLRKKIEDSKKSRRTTLRV